MGAAPPGADCPSPLALSPPSQARNPRLHNALAALSIRWRLPKNKQTPATLLNVASEQHFVSCFTSRYLYHMRPTAGGPDMHVGKILTLQEAVAVVQDGDYLLGTDPADLLG